MVKKNYDDMLSRFHLIPERHGRTDRQNAISISRVSVLTRDKNERSVIFNEEMVGGRERVTTDEERVLRGG